MKKFLALFCFVVVSVFALAGSVYAVAEGVWQFPGKIKTYIQPGHKNTQMMRNAFAEWTRLTKGHIVFKYVTSPNVADIKVLFVKKIDQTLAKSDRPIGLAVTSSNRSKTRLFKATIYIADLTQEGKVLNRDEVYTTMLHEIGHALGLNHSNDPESVMYPYMDVIQEISIVDLRALKARYGW